MHILIGLRVPPEPVTSPLTGSIDCYGVSQFEARTERRRGSSGLVFAGFCSDNFNKVDFITLEKTAVRKKREHWLYFVGFFNETTKTRNSKKKKVMELQMAGRCRHYCASVLRRSSVLYHISLSDTALVVTCEIYDISDITTSSLLFLTYVLMAAMCDIGLWKCSRCKTAKLKLSRQKLRIVGLVSVRLKSNGHTALFHAWARSYIVIV